jgi:hypothetical protein
MVHGVELVHETPHGLRIHFGFGAGDIDLGEVVGIHGAVRAWHDDVAYCIRQHFSQSYGQPEILAKIGIAPRVEVNEIVDWQSGS